MDPHLDATAQADLVRSGEVTSQELVEGAIERIEALNGELNAVIHPLFEKALAAESWMPCPAAQVTCTTPEGGWANENK